MPQVSYSSKLCLTDKRPERYNYNKTVSITKCLVRLRRPTYNQGVSSMSYDKVIVPRDGEKVTVNADLTLNVPNHPIIPFVEGDGIGVDITPVMIKVVNAAVDKAYHGKKSII